MKNNKTFYCIICLISVIILIWSLSRNISVEKFTENMRYKHDFLRLYSKPIKKEDKINILINSYNRPKILKKTIDNISIADLNNCSVLIYDDKSSDKEVSKILKSSKSKTNLREFNYHISSKNEGIRKALPNGFRLLKDKNESEFYCNLDSDVLVNPNFIKILYHLWQDIFTKINRYDFILTGFNTINHPFIKKINNYYGKKKHIGGINIFFHKSQFNNVLKQWDTKGIDWKLSSDYYSKGGIYCTYLSIIEHIGNIGLNSNNDNYDKAIDYISN
jgi:glycosyltransferase involved in cell wall biosynthesis|tara:strand:+ start:154 stop:978 length:825 start_codon:yes stop_codon:yes gene_type:complete